MQEQISEPLAQPLAPSSPPVKLWTPGIIAAISFLLGFPAGIVLASINWMRMNLSNKALTHLIAGGVGTFIVVILRAVWREGARKASHPRCSHTIC